MFLAVALYSTLKKKGWGGKNRAAFAVLNLASGREALLKESLTVCHLKAWTQPNHSALSPLSLRSALPQGEFLSIPSVTVDEQHMTRCGFDICLIQYAFFMLGTESIRGLQKRNPSVGLYKEIATYYSKAATEVIWINARGKTRSWYLL